MIETVPLARLLALLRADRPITDLLAITATEVLWTGREPGLARTAAHLFVARMVNPDRRAAYGALLAGGAVVVFGDTPDWSSTERSEPTAAWPLCEADLSEYPCAFDLITGHRTGVLPSPGAALNPSAGRLAITAPPLTDSLGIGPSAITVAVSVAADPPDPDFLTRSRSVASTHVSGSDVDGGIALAKCFGEACEYFGSNTGPPPDAVHVPADELGGPWLDPRAIIRYSRVQRRRLGITEFDPQYPHWWVPGERARQKVWLPAAFVIARLDGTPSWFHPGIAHSSGVAAHPMCPTAERSAWMELVERDAFQRCRALADSASPPMIETDSLPDLERRMVAGISHVGKVTVLTLDSPTGLPVVLVRVDQSDRTVLGCAASSDPRRAVRDALTEATMQLAGPVPVPIHHVTDIHGPEDHAAYYTAERCKARLGWMLAGRWIDWSEVERTGWHGDVSLPETAVVYRYPLGIDLPVHVVRVIDPALIPITFGFDADPAGREDFAALWRRSGRPLDGPVEPHPFA